MEEMQLKIKCAILQYNKVNERVNFTQCIYIVLMVVGKSYEKKRRIIEKNIFPVASECSAQLCSCLQIHLFN